MPLVSVPVIENLPNNVAFSRASAAWSHSLTGTLQQSLADKARIDFDPATLEARCLLIESERINSLRNSACSGAVAGTLGSGGAVPTNWIISGLLGGVNISVSAPGSEDGMPYLDLTFAGSGSGTFSLGFEATTFIAASSSQTWTASAYYRLISGSLANASLIHKVVERNSGGGTLVSGDISINPDAAALHTQRPSVTRTFNNASTAWTNARLDVIAAGAVNFTLRIGAPQLERGGHASSPIITTGSAALRAADIGLVQPVAPWFNQAAGTFFVEWERPAAIVASGILAEFNDGTFNNRVTLEIIDGKLRAHQFLGGASPGYLERAAPDGIGRVAFAWGGGSRALASSASSSLATDTANLGAIPADRLWLGCQNNNSACLNGWLRRIQYSHQRKSDDDLLALVA
ncbi:MAG: hypothetical protein IPI58_00050 [Alphaproteobacteria bacterium]|nr:MAG: hypothetical protein IPI58_00050 [Alphaproteobacteria bacterium]